MAKLARLAIAAKPIKADEKLARKNIVRLICHDIL